MDLLQQCQTQSFFQLPTESWVYVWLLAIKDFYKPIHTVILKINLKNYFWFQYLSIVLCALGAICNFCNIVVLTRRKVKKYKTWKKLKENTKLEKKIQLLS